MKRTELGERLEVPVSEERLAQGWEEIEARTFATPRPLSGRRRRIGVGMAIAAVLLAGVLVRSSWDAPAPLTVGGDPLGTERVGQGAREGETLVLDDGSRVGFAPGSRAELIDNRSDRLSVLLLQGEARFEVEPDGPRRWIVEAGLLTVEVVGTVFTVRRDDTGADVTVERGRVLVRSDRLSDRVRMLGAGESLRVEQEEPPPLPAEPSATRSVSPELPRPRATEASPEVVIPTPVERVAGAPEVRAEIRRAPTSAAQTSTSVASSALSAERVPPAAAVPESAAGLLALADEARRVGDFETALTQLARASRLAGDPDAALASFTRARIALQRGRASEASSDLVRALDLGLPTALEESARYRLVVALVAAADLGAARIAADEYLRRYPRGSFRREVERARP